MTELELVVLGSSASAPAPGDACSGYLVRHGETRVLLDCGTGTLSRLLQEGETLDRLSAIVVSHFHPDHYLDLVTMRYGLRYGVRKAPRLVLLVPPNGQHFLRLLGDALRRNPEFFDAAFVITEYQPTEPTCVGELRLTFCRTTHDEPTWAVSVAAPDGNRLVYTGDTRPCAELEVFARDATLLLCESTYPGDADELPSDNHLTSVEAGCLARRAAAKQLMLTHFWAEFPRERFAPGAETAYGAPVRLAAPGVKVVVRA